MGRNSRVQLFALALAGTTLLLAGGCKKSPPPDDGPATSASRLEGPNGLVSLNVLDYSGLQRLIAAKRGKVVVVDVWSTSCPPCVKSFPDLVALHQKIGPDKLACISVSLDYEGLGTPDRVAPAVLDFLKKQQATFDNVLASEESFAMLSKLGLSAPPGVFVYDQSGKLREKFTEAGGGDKPPIYQRVGELVEQLLKEG